MVNDGVLAAESNKVSAQPTTTSATEPIRRTNPSQSDYCPIVLEIGETACDYPAKMWESWHRANDKEGVQFENRAKRLLAEGEFGKAQLDLRHALAIALERSQQQQQQQKQQQQQQQQRKECEGTDDDRRRTCAVLGTLGITYWAAMQEATGEEEKTRCANQALQSFSDCLTAAKEAGDTICEGTVSGLVGHVHHSLGLVDVALQHHQRALAVARENADRVGEGMAVGNISNVYRSLGDLVKARELEQQCIKIAVEVGDSVWEGQTVAWPKHLVKLGISDRKLQSKFDDIVGHFAKYVRFRLRERNDEFWPLFARMSLPPPAPTC